MEQSDVVIVDYGVGNLLSVRRGLEQCGARVDVSSDASVIAAAARVVLPGVGAFARGMDELAKRGLDAVVRDVARRGTPLLAICLGMQMLCDESEEFGLTSGLGLIPGRVVGIPKVAAGGELQKVPHIGWSALVPPSGGDAWSRTGTVLELVRVGEPMYFVHSFMAQPANAEHVLAVCTYGGRAVPAVIGRDNVVGCQFHPEKSGGAGLRVLRAFLGRSAR